MSDEMFDIASLKDAGEEIVLGDKPQEPEIFPCGADFSGGVVDDLDKWKGLTNFLVPWIDSVSDPWRDIEKQRPIFEDAVEKAKAWFEEKRKEHTGLIVPARFWDSAIEVRVYPRTHQVVFFFTGRIDNSGNKVECGVPYMLSNDMVGFLKATNRWVKEPMVH